MKFATVEEQKPISFIQYIQFRKLTVKNSISEENTAGEFVIAVMFYKQQPTEALI